VYPGFYIAKILSYSSRTLNSLTLAQIPKMLLNEKEIEEVHQTIDAAKLNGVTAIIASDLAVCNMPGNKV